MPLQLTTAKAAVDDANAAVEYTQVKIVGFTILPNDKQIQVTVEYGNTVSDVWQWAMPYGQRLSRMTYVLANIEGGVQHYDDIVVAAASTAAGQSAYALAKQSLYQWLIDEGHFAGTIV